MKFFVDLFPLVVFFVAYHQDGMFVATGAVMAACAVQTAGYRLFAGAFDKNHLLALGLVLPFGAATLVFRDPAFIKWNGTAEMWLLATIFLGSHFVGDRPIVERMMGSSIDLEGERWRSLNLAWVLFFVVSGICNIVVAYQFDEATWVNFRMIGLTGMSIAFIGGQMWWLVRVMDDGEPPEAAVEREVRGEVESVSDSRVE